MSRIAIIGGTSIASGSGISSVGTTAPVGPLWSAATTGAIADAAAWTKTGTGISIIGGAMVLTAAVTSDTLTLTGAYATALEAVTATSTLYSVQVDITVWIAGANVRFRLRGSGAITYGSVTGNGTQAFTVTSGVATGAIALVVTGLTASPYTYTITDIRIYT